MAIRRTDVPHSGPADPALAETMRAAGAEVETAVYDGAPHSFFDRAFGDWQEACADAWQRMLALADRVADRR